ncbi:MAG: N-acetylmuramoyl-L-alanine amidase [Clostridiales bacterium]|nr:N-acetylmuramoyl-L-alanine amidase [Clostridiales bacterium]
MGKGKHMRRLRHGAETLMAASLAVIVGIFVAGAIEEKGAAPLPTAEPSADDAVETAQSEWTVVIDAGHGGIDGGAVGTKSGVAEAPLNLKVAELLRERLAAEGVRAVMTRKDENALGENKNADLRARKAIMNAPGVDAVVSIHMNRFGDPTVKGPMAFYMKGASEGQELAEQVIAAVTEAVGATKRGANPGDYYIVRESEAPAVIVECGFLSNAEEEALLQTAQYQGLLAEGIAKGIVAYLSEGGK